MRVLTCVCVASSSALCMRRDAKVIRGSKQSRRRLNAERVKRGKVKPRAEVSTKSGGSDSCYVLSDSCNGCIVRQL